MVVGVAVPTVAQAATYVGGCSLGDISPVAGACYGFFQKNVNGESDDMEVAQAEALAALGLVGPYTQVEHLDFDEEDGETVIDFDQILGGVTFISIHWGKGNGPLDLPGGGTGFYRLDLAPNANLDEITSNWGSLSNAVLWKTNPCVGRDCDENPGGDVPEPATWAMMILGFGGVGALMRRRRTGETFA